MTGEITLRGRVLPIGGVKEKVLGAHRAGCTHILVPKDNEADLDDLPEDVRDALTFHCVSTLDEALAASPSCRPPPHPSTASPGTSQPTPDRPGSTQFRPIHARSRPRMPGAATRSSITSPGD